MRIKINFTRNTSSFPIRNQSILNSYIHKCLGTNNKYHNAKSNYSISQIYGGQLNSDKETMSFEGGGYIVVSSQDIEFVNAVLIGVLNNQKFVSGMRFSGIEHITEQFCDGWNHFATLSPFLLKEYVTKGKYTYVTLNDPSFSQKIKTHLINKLSKIDPTLDLSYFDVRVPVHAGHKVKTVMVKNVANKANQCHVSIHCRKKIAEIIYNIGLGQSTGSGFGTIYKTENHRLYKNINENKTKIIAKTLQEA